MQPVEVAGGCLFLSQLSPCFFLPQLTIHTVDLLSHVPLCSSTTPAHKPFLIEVNAIYIHEKTHMKHEMLVVSTVAIGKPERHMRKASHWQQATIEITRRNHSIIADVILRAHPVRGESHNQRNANGEVATTSPPFYNELHRSHVLCVKADPGTTFTSWSQHHFVAIGNPERQVLKRQRRGCSSTHAVLIFTVTLIK